MAEHGGHGEGANGVMMLVGCATEGDALRRGMRATWRVRAANYRASYVCKPVLRPEAISGQSPNVADIGAAGPMRAVPLAAFLGPLPESDGRLCSWQ